MASLSSKSEKRFLVNFHTKNAMIPITATPPATDIPTIEPVPRPESPPPFEAAEVAEGAAELEEVPTETVTMTVLPPI